MREIAMIGTGSNGTAQLWDGQGMQQGNHFRWFFEPSLGFPELGFELFRRGSSAERDLIRLDFGPMHGAQAYSDGQVTVQTVVAATLLVVDQQGLRIPPDAPIEILFQRTAWYLRVGLQPEKGKQVKIEGSMRGSEVFSNTIKWENLSGTQRFHDCSMGVDRLLLSGDGWLTSCEHEFRDPNKDWDRDPIASLGLPVTHVRYPCRHSHADGTINGDEAEANSRLPQIHEILDRYLKPFQSLHLELVALATRGPAPQWVGSPSDPKLENVDHLDYILLLSLDPYLARILGLYYIDTEARTEFDYKVVGYWLSKGESGGKIRFAEVPNIHGSQQAWHRGFTLTSSVPARIEREVALFEGSAVSVKVELPPFKMEEVALFGRADGQFNAVVTLGDGSMRQISLRPTTTRELAKFEGPNVMTIEIIGGGKLLLESLSYKAVTKIVSYSAIAYHVSPHAPLSLPLAPKDLMAWELKGWALSPPPDAVGRNAVGLHWTPDVDFDEAGDALAPALVPLVAMEWYDFRRSPDQFEPQVTGSEPFQLLNDGRPILALPAKSSPLAPTAADKIEAERRRKAALQFLITGHPPADPSQPRPPVDPLRYLHTRLPDGWYGYRLRAVDLFGRISPPDQTGRDIAKVSLQNQLVPPSPVLLSARYIQQDDPQLLLTAEEDTWLENNQNKNGLRVLWAFPPALWAHARAIRPPSAPKTLTFKIYGPDMKPHSTVVDDPQARLSGSAVAVTPEVAGAITQVFHLKGAITAVEHVGRLVSRVTTDATLPAPPRREDVFAAALLVQGNTKYRVLGHTDGSKVTFWIERSTTDPQPLAGAFALNRSLVKTNVVFHRGAELLVGGSLSVGGNKSVVIAYNGGSEFLVEHDAATPPTTGRFSLLPFASFLPPRFNGISSKIKSSPVEYANSQTSIVEVESAVPTGGILVGGVVEQVQQVSGQSVSCSFKVLENTGGDPSLRKPRLTLEWIKSQTVPVLKFVKPQIGQCTIKAPSFTTIEADSVLPGLATGPRKVGGSIEQGSEEFNVLAAWEDFSSTHPTESRTYFLVSYRTGTTGPSVGNFTYYPAYQTIVPVPPEVRNDPEASVADVIVPVLLDTKITDVKEDANTNTVTVTTDRYLVCHREVLGSAIFRCGGNTYSVKKVTSLTPITVLIDKPTSATTPIPAVDSSCTLMLRPEVIVVKTNKVGKRWRWFSGGVLEQGSKKFQVMGYHGDAHLIVMKARDGSVPNIGAGSEFTYCPVSADDPTSQGLVSMTTVDPKDPSRESAQSASIAVTAVYRRKPEDFPIPALDIKLASGLPYPVSAPNPPCLQATPADWYGQSFYTLEWNVQLGMLYHVYRAMDASLYDLDREERASSSQPRPRITTTDLPARIKGHSQETLILQAIQDDFDNLDTKITLWKNATTPDEKAQRLAELEQAYKSLRNDTHEVLANLPHVETAFTLITKEPIKAYGTTASFRDELPGRSSNRFFYRIVAVDAAGNRSKPSPVSPPVCCPDLVPPAIPVFTKVIGGEQRLVLAWEENLEEDLEEYWLYRGNNEIDLLDLRGKTPLRVLGKGTNSFTDEPLDGLRNYFYRLVAVDNAGNVSVPSSIVSGRAWSETMPTAPTPTASWVTTGTTVYIRVEWSSASDDTLLQRRETSKTHWISLTGWLPPGPHDFFDSSVDPNKSYLYRTKARNSLNFISVSQEVAV